MKSINIFPFSVYEFKLINGQNETFERLERRTLKSDKFSSKYTDKSFIGKIQNNSFKLISSNIGKGAFCTLTGFIKDEHGEILVEINKPFRTLIVAMELFPFLALAIQLFSKPNQFSPIMVVVCILQVLIIRFLFVEIFFKIISKQSIKQLSDVLDTEWIRKKG